MYFIFLAQFQTLEEAGFAFALGEGGFYRSHLGRGGEVRVMAE